MVGARTELVYENVSKSEWEGFAPYQENRSLKYNYNPQVFEHLFVDDEKIRDDDLVLIKNNFEAKFTSEEIAEMSFDTFIKEVFWIAVLIDLARQLEDVLEKNTYGLDGDLSELPSPERAEKLAKKKEVFDFFVEFEILPAGLDFNELEADEDNAYHDFFKIAFANLFDSVLKFDEEGNLIEGESDEVRYGEFIEKYAAILGVDKTEVKNNLDEYQKIYLKTKKVEYFTGNPELFTSLIDVLEHLNNEEEEKEKEKKKEKEKEETKKTGGILAAISGTTDYSEQSSSEIAGRNIIDQLKPPEYIKELITTEGRVDDEGNYVCDLDEYGVNLVFAQDDETKEFRLRIEDQNEKYEPENISFDSNNMKEVQWNKVEYNIDKINSIAVISDLGLSPFFKSGSELKMMQFVHLMVTPNLDDLNKEYLNLFDGIIIYANHDSINTSQEAALLEFVRNGKGLIALHAASHCFRNSPAYLAAIGGQFDRHGFQQFTAQYLNTDHVIMKGLRRIETRDETYIHKNCIWCWILP